MPENAPTLTPEMVARAMIETGWTVTYPHGEPIWKRSANGQTASIWEVAARKGKWQWDIHADDFSSAGGGGEDWYDDLEDAREDAERALGVGK